MPRGSNVRSKVEEYLASRGESQSWDTSSRGYDEYVRENIVGTPNECYSKIREYLKLGITRFYLEKTTTESRELFAKEVMRRFQTT